MSKSCPVWRILKNFELNSCYKCIKKNYSNLTIIEVNSRLSHLEDVDKIILLEDGNIEAIGNFNEIKENKLFKEFYRLQKENS